MDKAEFGKTMKILKNAYCKTLTPEQLETWYSFLGNYSVKAFIYAVNESVLHNSQFPSISELNELASKEEKKLNTQKRKVTDRIDTFNLKTGIDNDYTNAEMGEFYLMISKAGLLDYPNVLDEYIRECDSNTFKDALKYAIDKCKE